MSIEQGVRYLLAAAHAFRTVYVEQITERLKKAGVEPKEDWSKDDHPVMLPFQFVKMTAPDITRVRRRTSKSVWYRYGRFIQPIFPRLKLRWTR